MTSQHSVTQLLAGLKGGDEQAAAQLVDRYLKRLVGVSRRVYSRAFNNMPRPAEDEEDAALSALDSFLEGAREGKFPRLQDRTGLLPLLIKITIRKVYDQRERAGREKRGGPNGGIGFSSDRRGADVHSGGELARPDRGARKVERVNVDELIDRMPGPEASVELEDTYRAAFALLTDSKLRQIARMDLEGKTREEIAAACKVTERSVYRKLAYIHELWNTKFADAH